MAGKSLVRACARKVFAVSAVTLAALSPVRAQLDTLPLSITDNEHYVRFLDDVTQLNGLLSGIDSVVKIGAVNLCKTMGGKSITCTISMDTLRPSPDSIYQVVGIQTIFHSPFEVLGRIPTTRAINATDFGYEGQDHSYFVLFPPWVPARLTTTGLDSISEWSEMLHQEQSCAEDRFCRIIIREIGGDTLTSRLTALSDCYMLAGGTGQVPQRCNLLAVWDGKEWWVRGIIGYILITNFDTLHTQSLTESFDEHSMQSFFFLYDERDINRFAPNDFDLIVRGQVDEGHVVSAISRALSALPRPGLETTRHLGAIIGSANRRVSPILDPYREIVDVMVLIHPQPGAYVLWVRPSVLVNRYNDGEDRSYHLPNPADAQRYRNVLLESMRAHLSEICDRPLWSAQILTCNQ